MRDLAGKTIVITGATSGIGLHAAEALWRRGAALVLIGRDPVKGEAVLRRLTALRGDAEPALLCADLSRLAELRRVAGEIERLAPRIDVLVNNAGAIFTRFGETADGFERTFALNHMAYFRLSQLLLERLRASAPSRIVNVASQAHRGAILDFSDLQNRRSYSGWRSYQRSKLANILFTRALARRLEGSGVATNCLHPGFVASRFGDNNGTLFRLAFGIAKRFAITPTQAAETIIHLATTTVGGENAGAYFIECRRAEPSAAARDDAAAERLWAESERLVGV
jgi:NAD(P)-dependent dehydrogenase (short-subunit alcohol dehydrogenase family)